LLVDREGTLWFGAVGEGLHRLSRRVLQFWGEAEGLADPYVSSVAEDPTGRLWVGTHSDGLWNFSEQRFIKVQDSGMGQNRPIVYSVTSTDDGSIWVEGEQYLLHFNPEQTTRAYPQPPIRGEAIRALCADGTNLWVGTYYSTLIRVEGTNLSVVATNGSFGGGTTSLVREGPETLWIGTSDGLYRWERGAVKSWTVKDGLLTASIRALHQDLDGTLWIGTVGGGLARLRNGRIVNITTRQGLVDDVISQIVPDDFGHLWLGGNHGIMCVALEEIDRWADGKSAFVHPIVLGVNEGMLKEQCSGGFSPTALKRRNGRLLFPTLGGLAEIDPRALHQVNTMTPQALIEEILLDNSPQRLAEAWAIPPGDHYLEIKYTAPNLRSAERVQFRTRLEGLEADWVMVGTRRTISYAGLRPGRYVFRVSASNSRGVWADVPASLVITVAPHFWQSLWFGFAVLGLAGGGMFAWYRRHIAKLEGRREARTIFTRQLIGAR